MAMEIAPGLRRGFALQRMALEDGAYLTVARAEAQTRVLERPRRPLLGRDRDAGALRAAAANAKRAGVLEHVTFEEADVRESWSMEAPLIVCTNPPYGRRVDAGRDVAPTYRALGETVRNSSPRARVGIVMADRPLTRELGLSLRPGLTTDHGGVKVDFMIGSAKRK